MRLLIILACFFIMSRYAFVSHAYSSGNLSAFSKDELATYRDTVQHCFDFPLNDDGIMNELLCEECMIPSLKLRIIDAQSYPWLYQLECPNDSCRRQWYLCRKCRPHKFRTSVKKPSRVNHRNRRCKDIIRQLHSQNHQNDEKGADMTMDVFPDDPDNNDRKDNDASLANTKPCSQPDSSLSDESLPPEFAFTEY